MPRPRPAAVRTPQPGARSAVDTKSGTSPCALTTCTAQTPGTRARLLGSDRTALRARPGLYEPAAESRALSSGLLPLPEGASSPLALDSAGDDSSGAVVSGGGTRPITISNWL